MSRDIHWAKQVGIFGYMGVQLIKAHNAINQGILASHRLVQPGSHRVSCARHSGIFYQRNQQGDVPFASRISS